MVASWNIYACYYFEQPDASVLIVVKELPEITSEHTTAELIEMTSIKEYSETEPTIIIYSLKLYYYLSNAGFFIVDKASDWQNRYSKML